MKYIKPNNMNKVNRNPRVENVYFDFLDEAMMIYMRKYIHLLRCDMGGSLGIHNALKDGRN